MVSNGLPDINDVKRISDISNDVIRNLQITQCYYELSAVFAERISFDANWCTFATWASKQAGQTIRKEDLSRAIARMLAIQYSQKHTMFDIIDSLFQISSKHNKRGVLHSLCIALNITSLDRASSSVAKGNKKVFEEIGYEFARFISSSFQDETYNPMSIQKFCNELKPGLPPYGQQYLQQAFTRYYEALFEPDNKKKAELILLANLEVGFHEQTRLQPEIEDSLNAAVIDPKEFRNSLINTIFPNRGLLNKIRIFLLWLFGKLSLIDSAIQSLLKDIRHHLRLIITEHLMTITFPPDLCINLGEDLSAEYHVILKLIENTDLNLLLTKVDPTPNSLKESGAVDWADLPERIHFIADMFRCYQQSPDILKEPFSAEQVEALKEGIIPSDPL